VVLLSLTACGSVLTPIPVAGFPTPSGATRAVLATPTVAPEIYLTPVPPTPTFTPSPTPTPVIHIVASGDTLFGVALEYGVTVDSLVRYNGLDENDYLSIGQSLIIPLEEEALDDGDVVQAPVGSAILPTPTPLPLDTAGIALYETPVGGLWCMGEVINTTGGPVTNLQVEVTLTSPDGKALAHARVLAAADYLPSEGRAPFSVLFREPPNGVTDVVVRLVRGEPVSPITASFVPLTVTDVDGAVSGPQYRVRGTLGNDAGQALSRISVVATIYNEAGNVVGYRQLAMGDDVSLSTGDRRTFDMLLTPQEVAAPVDFRILAWGVTS